ncbi:MAG: hybrid sensor histidine kinase/response regulator [Chitinophagaceae bacterium]|nr:hybrid sensor histidine kinase/response regulator [Chitinophagaceae bacterium]
MAKILIVDDREDNLMSISSLLEPAGYQLVKANSGREALKILLIEYDFALILMDVQMPNLSGFETASLIYERERLRHIPIIFITAHSQDEENIFKGYKTGAVDYIYKPINPDLLRAKVSVFVELYRKNHQLIAQEQKLIAINKNLENEINERKNSEEKVKLLNLQLLQNIDKLEVANKDLDRFAFMASHDLQEPLRKINVFSERLDSEYGKRLDEGGKKYINRIQTATARLQALIKDILTFSKISIDKTAFVNSDLTPLVKDVLLELDDVIKEKKAEVQIEQLPNLAINPNLMRPLFYNLIHNSLKYSKKDIKPVIRIYSETESAVDKLKGPETKNKYARIFISDNGIGFEQVFSEQIFDMFKRLHNQNEYEGTGIGLALCKKIVEEHNGFISAKSAVGEGSTFVISLPMPEVEKPAPVKVKS